MADNSETLNGFLEALNDHDVDKLMSLFCDDDQNLGVPFVGIALRGPQFKFKSSIRKLFAQLLSISFQDMAWTPAAPLRLTDGNTIAVEIDVTAKHVREWFTDSFKSPPLSHIDQATIDDLGANKRKMDIPACAVFTFGDDHRVQQLAIYMDRYKMMDQLAPPGWTHIGLPKRANSTAEAQSNATRGRRITITIED